jgi:hypothetical protein
VLIILGLVSKINADVFKSVKSAQSHDKRKQYQSPEVNKRTLALWMVSQAQLRQSMTNQQATEIGQNPEVKILMKGSSFRKIQDVT